MACRDKVLPAFHDAALELNITNQLPTEVANLFSVVKDLNTERNQHILSNAKEIAAAFNQAGIQPLLLKGLAHILAGIYPTVGTRYLADVDLLVSENDFNTAVQLLKDLGYRHDVDQPLELFIGHSYPPLHRPNSVEIDLHRTVGLGICSSILPAAEVLANSTVVDVDGTQVRIPSPEHVIVHHILHSQLHDTYRERISPSVRTMYDFVLLQNGFGTVVDLQAIEQRFRRHGKYGALAMYLLRVEQFFGVASPLPLHLDLVTRVCWWRRQLLYKLPFLRFADPLYYWFGGLIPRTRRLREILKRPGGLRYLAQKFVDSRFYDRLRADFR
jgi:hypothetical protein